MVDPDLTREDVTKSVSSVALKKVQLAQRLLGKPLLGRLHVYCLAAQANHMQHQSRHDRGDLRGAGA